jgi:predicted ATPase
MAAPEDAFLPKSVLSAFTRRLARLSESSREALTLAALSEPSAEFDFERWVLLLGGESQRELARQTLEEAETRRLVRQVAEGRYAFRVADIDKVLTAALPDTRRRDLHRHMAETLRRGQADFTLIRYHEEQA